jgi:diguanylate cyclase (GGDEF)-like protein
MQELPSPSPVNSRPSEADPILDDGRSTAPVERLLEDSWTARWRRVSPRELLVESAAASLLLALAIPLALATLASERINVGLAAALVALYALSSGIVKFPIGAGYVVPSYMVLVPMLLLLPPGTVPLLTACGLVLGTLGQAAAKERERQRLFFAISNAWHTFGPVAVLLAAGSRGDGIEQLLIYSGAFLAGCLVDLLSATLREVAILGIGVRVQIRVITQVWLIDACIAPLGLVVAIAARHQPAAVTLIAPFNALLWLISRERTARIAQAQRRLDLIARERTRLQAAVRRLGEALAAKLDLDSLTNIVLRGSVEALDADAGRLELQGLLAARVVEIGNTSLLSPALEAATESTFAREDAAQVERDGMWALSLPLSFTSDAGRTRGALTVAREGRAFRDDERDVMHDLVERARRAAMDIVTHQLLREQAVTDSLTKLGNRRKLAADLADRYPQGPDSSPLVMILFDLDGFKNYNDTFGHLSGDALLTRLGSKLAEAVKRHGSAYRLGGDEFCVLAGVDASDLHTLLATAATALEERGEKFAVRASYGAVLIPHEATTLDYALQLADERMYAHKKRRPSHAGDQARDVLIRIMHAKQPSLEDHSSEVAQLCHRVGRRFGMTAEQLDELVRAAELHDIGKVGIPDAILEKPEDLDGPEWAFMHQHTILGERILSAAPALRPVGVLVRSSHERWDGKGYPDGLAGNDIPLGARIIAACDAYEAMTTDRCYRPRREHEAACRELRRQAGRQFDPQVVELLLDELRSLGEEQGAETRQGHSTHAQAADEVAGYLRQALAQHELAAGEAGGQ